MGRGLLLAALIWGMIPAAGFAQVLQLGTDNVAWENNNDTGPILYREVPEAQFVSVRAKISAQTAGFWSQAGVIARVPNPIDLAAGQENWATSWSFRAPAEGPFVHQANMVTLGVEQEGNDGNLTANDLQFVRLDNLGDGSFQAYRGTGPDDAIVWSPQILEATMEPQPLTNANMVGQNLQIGVAGGAIGALAGASVLFDWVEIVTTGQTFRDDFNYTRDLAVDGVLPGGIWTGVDSAFNGGVNTQAGDLGRCVVCNWNVNGSGDFNAPANWMGDTNPTILLTPDRNDTTAVFGATSVAGPAAVYTNRNVTLKQIDFDNATNSYVFGGAGSITLDANSGSAVINVLNGSHEIQADLILADNVTATAAAGATLDINAAVILNGRTFMTAGAGTINLNNGTIAVGGAGGGSLVNDGNLAGLGAVSGDFTQSENGSLAVELGSGSVIDVLGAAELGGTLEVSLADGFVPAPGATYTVLTAVSVSNQGLALSGAAAGLFSLSFAGGALTVTAVPEPTTAGLLIIGAIAAFARRRRSPAARHLYRVLLIALCVGGFQSMDAGAETLTFGPGGEDVTYRDEFTTSFNYYTPSGAVPTGTFTASLGSPKSWTGVHNPQNGGDPVNFPDFPALFESNGATAPGALFIEDQVAHPNTSGEFGVGWEGNKNTAPFLYANVDAGDNFEATIKIDTQTAGNWSYAPMIVRRAGPPVGLGLGDTLDPTEAFVTIGSFRPTPDDPVTTDVDESMIADILLQNVGDFNNDGAVEENEAGDGVDQVGFPLWVRMTKEASRFTASSSLDGVTFTDRGAVINPFLNTAGQLLEVGPSFMSFTGGTFGTTAIDYFEVTVQEQRIFEDATWTPAAAASGSGNWSDPNSWDSETAPGQVPNANTVNVTLANANGTTGPASIYNNAPITIRSLTFNSANKYAITGTGGITLEPYPLHATDNDATYISVESGSHEIQVDLGLSTTAVNDNRIVAAPGSRLDINNTFNVNGKTLFVQGGGEVKLNNNIDTGTAGTVIVNGGNLGGSGRVNANLRNGDGSNPGGIISPGQSIGTLTVDGTFTQHSSGKLEIELAGTTAGTYDRLNVLSVATLDGLLDVKIADGFTPTVANIGQTWDVITAPTIINTLVISLDASDSPYFSLTCVNCTSGSPDILRLTMTAVPPPPGLIGDYNENGVVDAADYTVWRNALGTASVLPNRDPANMGNVSTADYASWKSNFGNTGAGSTFDGGAVPEPTSLLLLIFGAAVMINGRRRPCP
jgi:hypothetical protein